MRLLAQSQNRSEGFPLFREFITPPPAAPSPRPLSCLSISVCLPGGGRESCWCWLFGGEGVFRRWLRRRLSTYVHTSTPERSLTHACQERPRFISNKWPLQSNREIYLGPSVSSLFLSVLLRRIEFDIGIYTSHERQAHTMVIHV